MALAAALAAGTAGCGKTADGPAETSAAETTAVVVAETVPETSPVIEGLSPLTMDGPDYDTLKNLPVPETEAPPEYIRIGESYEMVADLQERLMELGFVPGGSVRAVQESPWGDPVAYAVCGAVIALRRADARRIAVRPA